MTHAVPRYDDFVALLRAERLIPVLRAADAAALSVQAVQCLAAGLGVIELTATTPGWQGVLTKLNADPRFDAVTVGVGTIVSADAARHAVAAGAQFLVSPYAAPEVRTAAGGVPFLEGGLTPGELAPLVAAGHPVKLFPASSVGASRLRALLDVLPGAVIVPTGGITAQNAEDWIRAGAVAVGMGGSLLALGADAITELRGRLQALSPAAR